MERTKLGVGIAAAMTNDAIRRIAAQTESLGYASFWVTDGSRGDGMRAIAEVAAVTKRLQLGIGVVPLSHRSPVEIIEAIRAHDLPLERLILGIGSGPKGPGALQRVREAAAHLRRNLNVPVFLGALGPNMTHLSGEVADGVLFSWLGRGFAPIASQWAREGAERAGRPVPTVASYVRIVVGQAGLELLADEGERYSASPAYADHFARMGVRPVETGVVANTLQDVPAGLAAWDGVVDEAIIKPVVPADDLDELLSILATAAPSRPAE